jgi:cysteine desulfurase
MSNNTIYLDNNATTAVAPEALEAMMPFLTERYGNPSSMHSFGGAVGKDMTEAREKVAALIGAHPDEILFTSCGTESDNTAVRMALELNPNKRHIVTSRVEHPAIGALCRHLHDQGYSITEVGVDAEGMIDLREVEAALTPETAICSIMSANNETGVIFPAEEIAQLCKHRGILFHTDAVQSVGKIPTDMSKSVIDMLSISGHKLHAPKGIGVLYVRKGTRFKPFILGGHQEHGRRAGTEAIPHIIGLGKACELALDGMVEENTRVRAMRDRLEQGILSTIANCRLNGHKTERLPNTTNIAFEFIEGELILLYLDPHGVCASSGSACTSGSLQPSHVLTAMGVPISFKQGAIRFSLSRYNTDADIDATLEAVPQVINRLREISPFGKGKAAMVEPH